MALIIHNVFYTYDIVEYDKMLSVSRNIRRVAYKKDHLYVSILIQARGDLVSTATNTCFGGSIAIAMTIHATVWSRISL